MLPIRILTEALNSAQLPILPDVLHKNYLTTLKTFTDEK